MTSKQQTIDGSMELLTSCMAKVGTCLQEIRECIRSLETLIASDQPPPEQKLVQNPNTGPVQPGKLDFECPLEIDF